MINLIPPQDRTSITIAIGCWFACILNLFSVLNLSYLLDSVKLNRIETYFGNPVVYSGEKPGPSQVENMRQKYGTAGYKDILVGARCFSRL